MGKIKIKKYNQMKKDQLTDFQARERKRKSLVLLSLNETIN